MSTTLHRVVAAVLVVASGIALMVAVRSAQAAPQAPVSVFIKAENLDGTRPDGGPVSIRRLNVDLHGNDASALEGTGTAFSTTGAHVTWSFTGSMTGDVVTLTGEATDANNPALIGMPGSLVANAATGTVTLSWTLPVGTGTVQGDAKVAIRLS